MRLTLSGFTGEIPRLLPRNLPPNAAQIAQNVRLTDGGLVAVRKARVEETLSAPVDEWLTIYKFGATWLSWETVVSVAPAPIAADRLYYTGDGTPKMLDGVTEYELALPGPTGALTGTLGGVGAGDVFSRVYVYTWVTGFGEESEPSPASNTVAWQAGNTVTLSGFASTPSGRNITKQRIYRSQTGASGGTSLFFIAERAAANTNYVDSIAVDTAVEPIPSISYNPPPAGLEGLTALPNGMMAAFVGKSLYFSEPYQPHAWPEAYILTVDYPIKALGATGQGLVVATEGTPYLCTGTTPDAMTLERIDTNLPCASARSMVDLGYSVAYATPDGIAIVSTNAAQVVTEALFNRDLWQTYTPSSMIGGQFNSRYVLAFDYIEPTTGLAAKGAFFMDLRNPSATLTRGAFAATAMFYEVTTGKLFYLEALDIMEWDPPGEISDSMYYFTKPYVTGGAINFSFIRVDSGLPITQAEIDAIEDAILAAIAANAAAFAADLGGDLDGAAIDVFALNGDALVQAPTIGRDTTINLYCDGVFRQSITQADAEVRLKANYMGRRWQIEILGTLPIERISLAQSAVELKDES